MQWGLAASKARLLSLWSLSNCCTFNWHVSSEQNQCCGCFAAKSFWCFVSLWHFAFIVIFTCLMLTFHPPSPEDGFSTWKCSLTLSSSCNAFVFKSAILDFIKNGIPMHSCNHTMLVSSQWPFWTCRACGLATAWCDDPSSWHWLGKKLLSIHPLTVCLSAMKKCLLLVCFVCLPLLSSPFFSNWIVLLLSQHIAVCLAEWACHSPPHLHVRSSCCQHATGLSHVFHSASCWLHKDHKDWSWNLDSPSP